MEAEDRARFTDEKSKKEQSGFCPGGGPLTGALSSGGCSTVCVLWMWKSLNLSGPLF